MVPEHPQVPSALGRHFTYRNSAEPSRAWQKLAQAAVFGSAACTASSLTWTAVGTSSSTLTAAAAGGWTVLVDEPESGVGDCAGAAPARRRRPLPPAGGAAVASDFGAPAAFAAGSAPVSAVVEPVSVPPPCWASAAATASDAAGSGWAGAGVDAATSRAAASYSPRYCFTRAISCAVAGRPTVRR